MMNVEERFKALAARARDETVPAVDVTAGVLAILSAGKGQATFASERPWMWLAAVSSAAAAACALFVIVANYMWSDPLTEIVQAISWAM